MATSGVEQLILVPARTDAELAAWGAAALAYAQAFAGVSISNDPTLVLRDSYERLTIVQPEFWPAEMQLWIKQAGRKPGIEYLAAPNPQVLAEILNVRVYYNLRFGFETAYDWTQQWPAGAALIGLHGRADGELLDADFQVARTARLEAVKITSHATPATVDALRALNARMFILVRPFMSFYYKDAPRQITPWEFVDSTRPDLQRLFDDYPDIAYIEVHNEPNLVLEGLGGSWQNGSDFAGWFLEVVRLYRQLWPEKKYGFPGLSPGPDLPGVRQDLGTFRSQAALAIANADWIGVHGYWQTEGEMHSLDGGFGWRTYRRLYPDKLLFMTEFGNPTQTKGIVANQYARYYALLRRVPGIAGAFSYISSTSDLTESARWAWTDEAGRDVGIAREVGRRRFIR